MTGKKIAHTSCWAKNDEKYLELILNNILQNQVITDVKTPVTGPVLLYSSQIFSGWLSAAGSAAPGASAAVNLWRYPGSVTKSRDQTVRVPSSVSPPVMLSH